jgi:hypothetical protein
VFGNWIEAERYVRTNPLDRLQIPKVPRTIVEMFTPDQMTDPPGQCRRPFDA